MNTFRLSALAATALIFTACPDGGVDDDFTDTNSVSTTAECMFASDGETPDIFPNEGEKISTIADSTFEECEEYAGPVLLVFAPKPSCSGDAWTVEFEHRGPSTSAFFYMHDSAGGSATQANWWKERHPVTDGKSGPNGWYERYELSLSAAATPAAVVEGTSTLHKCASNNDTTLVFGYEVREGTTVADCMIISPTETTDAFVDEFETSYPAMASCDIVYGWID